MSIKHREKIELLGEMDKEKLVEVESPVKYFRRDKLFSLGKGSNGTCVYVGIMEDGNEVAIKAMVIEACEDDAENEKHILTLIKAKKSPFIVNYRHFFRDVTFIYLIVDLCEETLNDHVHSQSIEHLQKHGPRMIKEILTGLQCLHAQGILHRDLKPSNILVDVEDHMKLADFGLSRILKEDETTIHTDAKGTQGWMAAEVIKQANQEVKCRFKKKSDIQVAGMIAFFIVSRGEHPFGPSYDRMANILKGNPVNLEQLDDMNARAFVSKLICHKLEERPNAEEALAHTYLRKENDCDLSSNMQNITLHDDEQNAKDDSSNDDKKPFGRGDAMRNSNFGSNHNQYVPLHASERFLYDHENYDPLDFDENDYAHLEEKYFDCHENYDPPDANENDYADPDEKDFDDHEDYDPPDVEENDYADLEEKCFNDHEDYDPPNVDESDFSDLEVNDFDDHEDYDPPDVDENDYADPEENYFDDHGDYDHPDVDEKDYADLEENDFDDHGDYDHPDVDENDYADLEEKDFDDHEDYDPPDVDENDYADPEESYFDDHENYDPPDVEENDYADPEESYFDDHENYDPPDVDDYDYADPEENYVDDYEHYDPPDVDENDYAGFEEIYFDQLEYYDSPDFGESYYADLE